MMARPYFDPRWILLIAAGFPLAAVAATPSAQEIIRRSVQANEADWSAAPHYAFTERDVTSKRGHSSDTSTYKVLMIDGSDYNRLVATNDRPLSPAENADEERKLRLEIARRRDESPRQRARRIAKYERERRQDHDMMNEMTAAFHFTLAGEGIMNGREVYILDAAPKPDYVPSSRNARVLTGMRGRLWIDQATGQWVKVEAEVVKPVEFGGFIARVGPGTKFELEKRPIGNTGIWLPSHFAMKVNASVLGFYSENSTDDETYTAYEPNGEVLASLSGH